MKKLVIAVIASSILGAGLVAIGIGASDRAQAQTQGAAARRVPAGVRPPQTPAQNPACGGDGQPHCPLQQWMEDNVTPAVEAGDAAALGVALTKIATFAPDPSWNTGAVSWRGIAEAAAAKARAGDFRGARASCKQCHEAFRARYRTEFRTRPVPR
ncbi:MAG: hypothetical protein IPK60_16465 [Sandaracinaceae bacterium]|nr:hypothetical protein [Sandaracinaceae bacterium]